MYFFIYFFILDMLCFAWINSAWRASAKPFPSIYRHALYYNTCLEIIDRKGLALALHTDLIQAKKAYWCNGIFLCRNWYKIKKIFWPLRDLYLVRIGCKKLSARIWVRLSKNTKKRKKSRNSLDSKWWPSNIYGH